MGPQRDYSFNHVLVQEAVYSTLLKGKRVAYHEAIGRAIEALYPDSLEEHAEVLAQHFQEAGNACQSATGECLSPAFAFAQCRGDFNIPANCGLCPFCQAEMP